MDRHIPCEGDRWMEQSAEGLFDLDFREFLDWEHVQVNNLPNINYTTENNCLSFRQDTNTVNLLETIKNSNSLAIKDPDELIRLKLNAKW